MNIKYCLCIYTYVYIASRGGVVCGRLGSKALSSVVAAPSRGPDHGLEARPPKTRLWSQDDRRPPLEAIYTYVYIHKQYIHLEFSQKIREIEIPNNSRISVSTPYLTNLVYWVGFAAGMKFRTHF